MKLDVITTNDLETFKVELFSELKSYLVEFMLNNQQKIWLTEKDACEMLDVSKSTIQNYRLNGMLPFSQIKNKIKYKKADIQELLEKNYVSNGK